MSRSSKRKKMNKLAHRPPQHVNTRDGKVDRLAVQAAMLVQETRSEFRGPLPPPELLKQYDEVQAGVANRIITMAENQSEHRQILEKKVVSSDIIKSYLGIFSAFTLSLTMIIGGLIIANNGQDSA